MLSWSSLKERHVIRSSKSCMMKHHQQVMRVHPLIHLNSVHRGDKHPSKYTWGLNEELSNYNHEWRGRSDWNTDDANNSFVSRECEGNLRQQLYVYNAISSKSLHVWWDFPACFFCEKKAGEEPGSKAMGVCLCIAASKDVPQCNKIPQHHCILWGLADPLHLRNISSCFCSKLK